MGTLSRPLRRSVANRQVAGVCGGIAEHFDWDPTLVRVGYVLLSITTAFSGFLVYLILGRSSRSANTTEGH